MPLIYGALRLRVAKRWRNLPLRCNTNATLLQLKCEKSRRLPALPNSGQC